MLWLWHMVDPHSLILTAKTLAIPKHIYYAECHYWYTIYRAVPICTEGEKDGTHVCCEEWSVFYREVAAEIQIRCQYQRFRKSYLRDSWVLNSTVVIKIFTTISLQSNKTALDFAQTSEIRHCLKAAPVRLCISFYVIMLWSFFTYRRLSRRNKLVLQVEL